MIQCYSCEDQKEPKDVCFSDPSTTFRFYEIEVKVTDLVGNVGTATCNVIVVPMDHKRKMRRKLNTPAETRALGSKDEHVGEDDLYDQITSGRRYTFPGGSIRLDWDSTPPPDLTTTLTDPDVSHSIASRIPAGGLE